MKLHVGNPPVRIETGGRYKLTGRVFHSNNKRERALAVVICKCLNGNIIYEIKRNKLQTPLFQKQNVLCRLLSNEANSDVSFSFLYCPKQMKFLRFLSGNIQISSTKRTFASIVASALDSDSVLNIADKYVAAGWETRSR